MREVVRGEAWWWLPKGDRKQEVTGLMMRMMIIMLLLFMMVMKRLMPMMTIMNDFGLMLIWSGHRALAHGNLQTGSQAANFYDHNNYNHDIML